MSISGLGQSFQRLDLETIEHFSLLFPLGFSSFLTIVVELWWNDTNLIILAIFNCTVSAIRTFAALCNFPISFEKIAREILPL